MLTRVIALGPALIVAVAGQTNDNTMSTTNEWLNILQSIQLPFAIIPLMVFSNDRALMKEFSAPASVTAFGWCLVFLVLGINYYQVGSYLFSPINEVPHTWWFYVTVGVGGVIYTAFVLFLMSKEIVEWFTACRRRPGELSRWEDSVSIADAKYASMGDV